MKQNGELEKQNVVVDGEIEIDGGNPQVIVCYLETWFDVDKKFHLNINDEEGTWLNMYALYNPFEDSLRLQCCISRRDSESEFSYEPTNAESRFIKDMVGAKLREKYNQTPQEFCQEFLDEEQEIGGLRQ